MPFSSFTPISTLWNTCYKSSFVLLLILTLASCGSNPTQQQASSQTDIKQTNIGAKATESSKSSKTHIIIDKTSDGEIISTADIWTRIRSNYQLPETMPTFAQERMNGYLKRYQKYPHDIYQQTERAGLYLYYIVDELEKHNMPMELALLPFVESSYNPFAYSSGRASGLWQFIPGTGKRFKLKENWWLDERRDVVKSTQAAIAYLSYLYQHFDGDWLLAIAAYNAGEGTIGKAIRKNKRQGKATDYWSLSLPRETQFYIPKLMAWASIVKQPKHYGLALAPVENTAQFASIDIGSQIDLAKLSEISQTDINTIYALNPAYNRWATDPNTPHTLLLPTNKIEHTKQALLQYPTSERIQWQRYTIKKNDSLSVIAQRFKTSVASIKAANQLKSSRIRIGKTLLIPNSSKSESFYTGSAAQRLASRQKQSSPKNANKIEHIVQKGDTLWSIGKKYGVSSSKIAYWNNMSTRDVLRNQQKLIIWTKKQVVNDSNRATNTIRKVIYQVRKGDNLSRISHKFNVAVSDIRNWNKLNQKYLQPGQKLKLFISMADQASRFK